jgi:hypothetical protein
VRSAGSQYTTLMEIILKYRGRIVTADDVKDIQRLIADNPTAARYTLSNKLCEFWDWRQPNGELKGPVCRSLMLSLYRSGHITLPEARVKMGGPVQSKEDSSVVAKRMESVDKAPIEINLADLGPLDIKQVRRSQHEKLFNSLIETFHYLGFTRPVGEHLKYMVWAQGRPVACMIWCSPIQHLNCRDNHIGWSAEQRLARRHFIAYNTRYLILPWVRVPHLASYLLGYFSRRISKDWEDLYAHSIFLLETFIEPERYKGTCYRAANWKSLGMTSGRGFRKKTSKGTVPTKELLVLPLHKKYRELMCAPLNAIGEK